MSVDELYEQLRQKELLRQKAEVDIKEAEEQKERSKKRPQAWTPRNRKEQTSTLKRPRSLSRPRIHKKKPTIEFNFKPPKTTPTKVEKDAKGTIRLTTTTTTTATTTTTTTTVTEIESIKPLHPPKKKFDKSRPKTNPRNSVLEKIRQPSMSHFSRARKAAAIAASHEMQVLIADNVTGRFDYFYQPVSVSDAKDLPDSFGTGTKNTGKLMITQGTFANVPTRNCGATSRTVPSWVTSIRAAIAHMGMGAASIIPAEDEPPKKRRRTRS